MNRYSAALLPYVIIFSLGMETIAMVMLSEIFLANAKALALCVADIYYALVAIA